MIALHLGVGLARRRASNTLRLRRAPAARPHRRASGRRCRATSTFASIDRPTRSGCAASCFGSSAMRTGTRCTTLIQLPVAFCAGSSAKAAPVPAPRPATVPWYSTLLAVHVGRRASPAGRCACCAAGTSLKLASTHTWSSGDDRHQRRARRARAGRAARCAWRRSRRPARAARRALQREIGLAHPRRGALHVRVLLDRGAFGQRLVARRAARAPRAAADSARGQRRASRRRAARWRG